ncbi:MAG: hypothetical protein ABIQ76_00235 [Candidatus Limnocylindrales bacterium]
MDPTDETRQRSDEDALLALELARRSRRWKAEGGLGDMIGGAIVGFDYQVFRATKPPAMLVEPGTPVRGLSAADGSTRSLGDPEDGPLSETESSESDASASPG